MNKLGSSEEHTRILKETLLLLGGSNFCRVWRQETGMALNIRTGTPFKYGLVGGADIIGILNDGRFLAIEIKSGNAVQSKEQKNFEAMIKKFGGVYFVATSCDEALKKLTESLSST